VTHGERLNGQVAASVLAANREMYAIALGCTLEEARDRWARALEALLPPVEVSDGPVKEEVHAGAGLLEHGGLREFPIPIATNGWEAFPRITAAAVFSRDPETGVVNAGMYNSIVLGPDRANLRTSRHLHLHWEKCRQQGVPLQVAIVIGGPPVIPCVAASDVPFGISELSVAGGFIGEPIPVVRCESVDLLVPATAEVVIEGTIPIDAMDRDAPSGENRGHVMLRGPVHPFHVTAICHRRDPIWHDVVEGFPPTESSTLRSFNCEGRVLALLRAHGIPYVKDVAFHHCGSARHFCAISFRDLGGASTPNSSVWQALFAVMSADPSWPKIAIAVDDDVDPHDVESVMWAVVDRCQPHRDVKIIQGRAAGLDESVAPYEESRRGRPYPTSQTSPQGASIMLLDATRKWAYPPVSLPRQDYMEHAREVWDRLGLPALRPRVPWHGSSLGRWPDDCAELVRLAEDGKEDEAARRLLEREI
jgi:UbiD family decarboxylase